MWDMFPNMKRRHMTFEEIDIWKYVQPTSDEATSRYIFQLINNRSVVSFHCLTQYLPSQCPCPVIMLTRFIIISCSSQYRVHYDGRKHHNFHVSEQNCSSNNSAIRINEPFRINDTPRRRFNAFRWISCFYYLSVQTDRYAYCYYIK